MGENTFMGVSRDKIDWSPRINYEKCNDCMECVAFCPHQVFEIQESGNPKLIVKNPDHCVVFCRACGKTCGPDALRFPDKIETTKAIKRLRKGEK